MLVAAALVPDTALIVPGAGGAADVAHMLRTAALAVVSEALAEAEVLVVVAPGRETREVIGTVVGTLGAAGIPDRHLGWPVPTTATGPGPRLPVGVSAAVGLHLAARAGWRGVTRVVEVAGGDLVALGAGLVDEASTALLVVGSGSARHGPDGPLADDERAPAHDAALLADLADAGPAARARLGAHAADEASALAVTGHGPWQVLVGAAGDRTVRARLERSEVLAGAQHAALLWRVAPEAAA
jgi:hypothetical protein